MRWLVLVGLLLVSCSLPPHSDPASPLLEILLDFPELAEWGHVVLIAGREYWTPDPAHFGDASIPVRHGPPFVVWAPYVNGAFYEDSVDGLVWVSFDPWGFITEHYGYWRHHAQLGYVWRPFYPLRWNPFVASIFHDIDGRLVGVCPFSSLAWEAGLYDAGFGFDDDYWASYWRTVHDDRFYTQQVDRLASACVTVTLYDAGRQERVEREPFEQRAREYRERHGHRAAQDPPRQDEPSEGSDSQGSMIIQEALPARPVTTAPSRVPEPESDAPASPTGLPTIPARDLEVKRPPQEAPLPRAAFETREMRAATPQRPASAESTTTRPPAGVAASPAKKAPTATATRDTARTGETAPQPPAVRDESKPQDKGAPAKKSMETRVKAKKPAP